MKYCQHDDDPLSCPPCQGAGQPKTLRRFAPFTPTILARFDGTCAFCDGQIASGDPLVRDEGAWIHAGCAEDDA